MLRADAGFAVPQLYDFWEAKHILCTIAIGANQAFKRQAQLLREEAIAPYQAPGENAKLYADFAPKAKIWPRHRRVLSKAAAGPEGTNTRFVVTKRAGDQRRLFEFYAGRGQAENYIKELKNQFKADRLSCSRFAANALRLVLFALAYQLINLFRRRLSNPELRRARMARIVGLRRLSALLTSLCRSRDRDRAPGSPATSTLSSYGLQWLTAAPGRYKRE